MKRKINRNMTNKSDNTVTKFNQIAQNSTRKNTDLTSQSDAKTTEKEDRIETAAELPDGSVVTKNKGCRIHTMTIVGQVEGHNTLPQGTKSTKYELLIPLLVEIEESPEIDGLLLILNTVGGDVEAGLAISELISSMKKPTVSLVLGGGHSIGVPLAVSTNYSFIAPSATMTLHPVRITGLVLGAPQTYAFFNRMQDRIINFVTKNSQISAEKFRSLVMSPDEMATDIGTVLDGNQAVDVGLIDEIGGLSNAIAKLKSLVIRRKPSTKS